MQRVHGLVGVFLLSSGVAAAQVDPGAAAETVEVPAPAKPAEAARAAADEAADSLAAKQAHDQRVLAVAMRAAASAQTSVASAAGDVQAAKSKVAQVKAVYAAVDADKSATAQALIEAKADVDAAATELTRVEAIFAAARAAANDAQAVVDTLSGKPPGATTNATKKAEAVTANLQALTTLPQLTALKGGSLGIPTTGVISGLQASIDARLLGDQDKTDAFAQLGGIQIRENSSVDIFAEVLGQDLPRYALDDGIVTKSMFDARISAAGIRGRFRSRAVQWVTRLDNPLCSAALSRPEHTTKPKDGDPPGGKGAGAPSQIALLSQDNSSAVAADAKTRCGVAAIEGVSFFTFTLGARVLRRSPTEEQGEKSRGSNGGAFEALAQYERPGWMGTAGVSGWRLGKGSEPSASGTLEFPELEVLRVTAGFEYRGSRKTDGTDIIPRVGVYGVLSHARWKDPYTFGTIDPKIETSEAEFGVYAGGKFNDKFSGVVAFRVVQPFAEQDMLYVVSLIPSVSAAVTK